MSANLAIFIDNRPSNIKTFFSRLANRKLNAPPLLTYERSYWYDERWDVMCKEEEKYNHRAIPTICGWCGQLTPVYPLRLNGSGGTSCHECGRTVDDFYRDWIYRAEYGDGCKVVLFQSGGASSCGVDSRSGFSGTHAPHRAFSSVDEVPVYEFLSPLLFSGREKFPKEELCLFFRKHVYEDNYKFPEHPISDLIASLPKERDIPHRAIEEVKDDSWMDEPFDFSYLDQNESFDGNVFTAYLIPKENPTKGNVKSTTLFAASRSEAFEIVRKSIDETKDFSLDEYNLFVSNGAALAWAWAK